MIEMRPRRFLSAALAIAVLAAAGCGSGSKLSGVSAASYVKSVCTTATGWRNAIQSAGTQLQAGASSKSLAKTKSAYVSFVSALVSATGSAESQLASAGSPAVKDGQKISSMLVNIFSSAKQNLSQAAADAQKLPSDSSKTFEAAAGKVQGDIRNALASMSNVTPEKNPALHSAAAKDPTCRSLAAGA